MNDRIAVQREAVRRGLQLRRSLSIPREHAINVFDVASSIGVEVQFFDLASLEGMFYRGPDPKIMVPSFRHRPRGRVTFSCAHELGHFELGHGTRVDKYLGDSDDDESERAKPLEEIAADTFAATILMPRPAILDRFSCRGWTIESASATELFRVASELDVGYTTLLRHLCNGLSLVNERWMRGRIRVTPKAIREEIAPHSACSRLVILDQHWPNVPVDLEVGDCVVIPTPVTLQAPSSFEPDGEHNARRVFRTQQVGEAKITVDGKSLTIRTARSGYCGLLKYRYLEDEGDA